MKFWLNAHLSPKFAVWLAKEFGVDCKTVKDVGLRDAKDQEIFRRGKEEGVILVTKDADFVDLVLRHGPPPQILLLTTGNTSNDQLKKIFSKRFPKVLELLKAGEAIVELSSAE